MNSDTVNIIPDNFFPAFQGEHARLIRVHPDEDRIDLRFRVGSFYQNVQISRSHWDFVQGTAPNHACLVVDFQIEERVPRHLYWSFPPGNYKYNTFMQSSEIAHSLVQDILASALGKSDGSRITWATRRCGMYL